MGLPHGSTSSALPTCRSRCWRWPWGLVFSARVALLSSLSWLSPEQGMCVGRGDLSPSKAESFCPPTASGSSVMGLAWVWPLSRQPGLQVVTLSELLFLPDPVQGPGQNPALVPGSPWQRMIAMRDRCCDSVQMACSCARQAGSRLDLGLSWMLWFPAGPPRSQDQVGCVCRWWHVMATPAVPPASAGPLPATTGAEAVPTAGTVSGLWVSN